MKTQAKRQRGGFPVFCYYTKLIPSVDIILVRNHSTVSPLSIENKHSHLVLCSSGGLQVSVVVSVCVVFVYQPLLCASTHYKAFTVETPATS